MFKPRPAELQSWLPGSCLSFLVMGFNLCPASSPAPFLLSPALSPPCLQPQERPPLSLVHQLRSQPSSDQLVVCTHQLRFQVTVKPWCPAFVSSSQPLLLQLSHRPIRQQTNDLDTHFFRNIDKFPENECNKAVCVSTDVLFHMKENRHKTYE